MNEGSFDLSKRIADLEKKALKYDNMHERYVEFAKRLVAIADELSSLAKEIDPVLGISTRQNSNIKFGEVLNECYAKMAAGIEISKVFLERAYPEFAGNKRHDYIIGKLGKMKNVMKRREGKRVFLYVNPKMSYNKDA